MDTSPSDAEIAAWIDKGLDTVEHFITSGSGTPPQHPRSQREPQSQGLQPSKPPRKQPEKQQPATTPTRDPSLKKAPSKDPGARPKQLSTVRFGPGVTVAPCGPEDSIYEEVIPGGSTCAGQKQPGKDDRKTKAKNRILSMQVDDTVVGGVDQGMPSHFKRGGDTASMSALKGSGIAIAENTPSIGAQAALESSSGATQAVSQLQIQEQESPVDVATVPELAPCVKEILRYLKVIETRMTQLEWKVDKIIGQNNMIQQIRNDQTALKANMATIEGILTTIKIMDPGVPTSSNASQVKKLFKESPVVISGPCSADNPLISAGSLQLDELARPSIPTTMAKKKQVSTDSEISGYRLTLITLISDCIQNPIQQQTFEKKAGLVKTEQEFKKLKREILRAAV
ncbi:phosphoprotein [Achimota virus 2]|uniref:Phosphoprotein n=1 Tax=Achimota virus 2 TaxID=1261101 RepID=K7XBD8_9MONO|nr:phosphoprotein [Achimota virus 2]AFX75112.1 phosphoprotein [Achimota virus 2]